MELFPFPSPPTTISSHARASRFLSSPAPTCLLPNIFYSTMAASSVTISTSTYETVQKWIGRQLESNAAVTDAQRDLLLNLEHTINPPPPPRAEPELDGINWIGLLQGRFLLGPVLVSVFCVNTVLRIPSSSSAYTRRRVWYQLHRVCCQSVLGHHFQLALPSDD